MHFYHRLVVIFILLGLCTKLNAATVEVCPDCPVSSVKEAILVADNGDEILIRGGTYKEGQIIIDKAVNIRGIDWPVIDGENETEIFTIISDDVTIQGLQIQNVGTSYIVDRAGIRIRKSSNFTITNNRLYNTFFGIYLAHSKDGTIANNEIIGDAVNEMSSGNGIHLWYCENIIIENNNVSHHRDGIYFEFVNKSQIEGNLSENNLRYGLHFMFSNDDDYKENTFRNNGAGVAVMFSKNINMYANNFEYNWGKASYGLLLKEIYDAEISNNKFRENTMGIFVESSTRINYSNNLFYQNGWAIKIQGGCLDNNVSGNNFISNTFDLSVVHNMNKNKFNGNYWSDYNGYDIDKDGIGDVPYRPVKLFNFVVNHTPEAMILLRSIFVDLINFTEKVSPVFTPKNVLDNKPSMEIIGDLL